MDIRILRYFLALANTETISGAAEILHTTQPNLSRQLSALEKEVLLAEEGVGCAFSFEHLINLSGDCALCFRPLSPKLTANAYIVWKKYQVFSKAAKKFLETLQQELN